MLRPKKRLFACRPCQLFQEGVGRSVGFFSSSSFSHKISVGRSGKLFKNFLLIKKTFLVGRNLGRSVGRENFLNTFDFRGVSASLKKSWKSTKNTQNGLKTHKMAWKHKKRQMFGYFNNNNKKSWTLTPLGSLCNHAKAPQKDCLLVLDRVLSPDRKKVLKSKKCLKSFPDRPAEISSDRNMSFKSHRCEKDRCYSCFQGTRQAWHFLL